MYLEILVIENKQVDRISPDKEVFLFLVYLSFLLLVLFPSLHEMRP